MPTVQELMEQRAALDRQIEEQKLAERSVVVDEFRALMARHGMTIGELTKALAGAKPKAPGSSAGKKVAVKYRDPDSQATWTGRGLQPKWLREKIQGGANLESFLAT